MGKFKSGKFQEHLQKLEKKVKKEKVKVKQNRPVKLQQIESTVNNKKQLFALDSDQEVPNDFGRDDYQDVELLSSDEGFEKNYVKNNHFVGFERSKKEIYEDIIKNSKIRKEEKRKLKEETLVKVQELNDGVSELLQILPFKKGRDKQAKETFQYMDLYQQFMVEPKAQVEKAVPSNKTEENKQRRQMRIQQQQDRQRQELESQSEEESVENDDQVQKKVKTERGRKILKQYKKVEHLQNMMEHIRKYKQKQISDNQSQSDEQEIDELDDIDYSDQQEDDDDENESDSEQENQSVDEDSFDDNEIQDESDIEDINQISISDPEELDEKENSIHIPRRNQESGKQQQIHKNQKKIEKKNIKE